MQTHQEKMSLQMYLRGEITLGFGWVLSPKTDVLTGAEGGLGHRHTEKTMLDTGRSQVQASERGLRRNQLCGHFDLCLLVFRMVRK